MAVSSFSVQYVIQAVDKFSAVADKINSKLNAINATAVQVSQNTLLSRALKKSHKAATGLKVETAAINNNLMAAVRSANLLKGDLIAAGQGFGGTFGAEAAGLAELALLAKRARKSTNNLSQSILSINQSLASLQPSKGMTTLVNTMARASTASDTLQKKIARITQRVGQLTRAVVSLPNAPFAALGSSLDRAALKARLAVLSVDLLKRSIVTVVPPPIDDLFSKIVFSAKKATEFVDLLAKSLRQIESSALNRVKVLMGELSVATAEATRLLSIFNQTIAVSAGKTAVLRRSIESLISLAPQIHPLAVNFSLISKALNRAANVSLKALETHLGSLLVKLIEIKPCLESALREFRLLANVSLSQITSQVGRLILKVGTLSKIAKQATAHFSGLSKSLIPSRLIIERINQVVAAYGRAAGASTRFNIALRGRAGLVEELENLLFAIRVMVPMMEATNEIINDVARSASHAAQNIFRAWEDAKRLNMALKLNLRTLLKMTVPAQVLATSLRSMTNALSLTGVVRVSQYLARAAVQMHGLTRAGGGALAPFVSLKNHTQAIADNLARALTSATSLRGMGYPPPGVGPRPPRGGPPRGGPTPPGVGHPGSNAWEGGLSSALGRIQATSFAALFPSAFALKKIKDVSRDAQEFSDKFNTVFSQVLPEAENEARTLARDYGLTITKAKELLGNTADLLVGFGLDQRTALIQSARTQKLAVDLASFQNLQLNSTGEAGIDRASIGITRAMLGEKERLKLLGVAIREVDIRQRIREMLKDGRLAANTSFNLARAQAVLDMAYDQSVNSVGDWQRTLHNLANQERITAARTHDMAKSLGDELKPSFLSLNKSLQSMAIWVEELSPATRSLIGHLLLATVVALALGVVLGGLGLIIVNAGRFFQFMAPVFTGLGRSIAALANPITAVRTAFTFVITKVSGLLALLRKLTIPGLILTAAFFILKGIFNGIWPVVKDIAGYLFDIASFVGKALNDTGLLQAVLSGVANVLEGLGWVIGTVIGGALNVVLFVIKAIVQGISGIAAFIAQLAAAIINLDFSQFDFGAIKAAFTGDLFVPTLDSQPVDVKVNVGLADGLVTRQPPEVVASGARRVDVGALSD